MRKAELSALTGIRFYAALFVFLSHVPLIPGMERLAGRSLLFNAGVVAVSFFFVLSGFILTYNYADVFQNSVSASSYKRFAWDRLTKIYPVHLLTLLMALPIQIFSPNMPLDWRALPFHIFLLQCFWPFARPTFFDYLNVPSWSISCEWFFYLLAPLAICFAVGRQRRFLPLILAGGYLFCLWSLLGYSQSDFARLYFVSWFAPSRFPEFLAGVYLARGFLANPASRTQTVASLAQLGGILLIVAGALYREHAPWPMWGGLLYLPGSTLLVFGLASGGGLFAAHLSRSWLHRLGTASFSFYMLQAPMMRALKGVSLRFGWEVSSWAGFCLVTALLFVLVQGTALMVCYVYEIPLQKKLRSLMVVRRGVSQVEAVQ